MGAQVCSNTGDDKRPRNPSFAQAADRDLYAKYEGDGPWFTCDARQAMPPRFAVKGPASEKEVPATTLMQMVTSVGTGEDKGKAALMIERVNGKAPELVDGKPPPALPLEEWTRWSFQQYYEEVRAAASGFVSFGFEQFDSVNVWGFNSPEWAMSAVAAGFAGGKVAGLYPTDTDEAAAYKVVHSGGSVVVIEDRGKLNKLLKGLKIRSETNLEPAKRLKAIVTWGFEPNADETVDIPACGSVPLLSWSALIQKGRAANLEKEIDSRVAATKPGHCAALIYTSGTTGDPKAVMISHDNIIVESSIIMQVLRDSVGFCTNGEQERIISYLPMSHVAGMMVDISMPVVCSASGQGYTTVHFARAYDLKVGAIKDRLCAIEPTIFLGVPLVWEKIADKMRAVGASVTGLKKTIATWAKSKGVERARGAQMGGHGQTPSFYGLADKIVLSKAAVALGLGKCKYGFTGAAPIRVDTLEYFGSLGIQINELYGMSECTGACTISIAQAHQWGSCGWEVPGCEVRIFRVDEKDMNKKTECPRSSGLSDAREECQGEICWRGRINMMGYMAQPDMGAAHVAEIQKKTAESIDKDGWLHSGDKGMLTLDGMVKITGRYKELIIGDGGENIAPVPIEDSIKKLCDGICEVMMVGDKRKYNVALITLKAVGANGEVAGTDDLDMGAKRINPDVQTISGAMKDQVWIDAITAAIKATNKNTKVCVNNAFSIQKFTILPTNFSEEGNELTPTKKLKRKVVETNYAKVIDKLYSTDGEYIPYE